MPRTLTGLPRVASGKGKDLYEIPGHPERLLLVARDSVSTHNVVHATPAPGKGELVIAQTEYFARKAFQGLRTHLVASGRKVYDFLPRSEYPEDLHRRSFVVVRSRKPDIEYVYRDYMAGSLYKDVQRTGTDPYGLGLAPDFPRMRRISGTILTPTRKSELDEPLLARDVKRAHPHEHDLGCTAFREARLLLLRMGVTLIDAKFEIVDGMLIDDWMNGDCARMCRIGDVREGADPPFLDKQRFREIAERRWGGGPKVPLEFSDDEVREGLAGYHEGFELVTGMSIADYRREVSDA